MTGKSNFEALLPPVVVGSSDRGKLGCDRLANGDQHHGIIATADELLEVIILFMLKSPELVSLLEQH